MYKTITYFLCFASLGFFSPNYGPPKTDDSLSQHDTEQFIKKHCKKRAQCLGVLFDELLQVMSSNEENLCEFIEDETLVKWLLCVIKELRNTISFSSLLCLLELSGMAKEPNSTIKDFSNFCQNLRDELDADSEYLENVFSLAEEFASNIRFLKTGWQQEIKKVFSYKEIILRETALAVKSQMQLRKDDFSIQEKDKMKFIGVKAVTSQLIKYIKGTRLHCELLNYWIIESFAKIPACFPECLSGEVGSESNDTPFLFRRYPELFELSSEEDYLRQTILKSVDNLTASLIMVFPSSNLINDSPPYKAPPWSDERLPEYLDYYKLKPLSSSQFHSHLCNEKIELPPLVINHCRTGRFSLSSAASSSSSSITSSSSQPQPKE